VTVSGRSGATTADMRGEARGISDLPTLWITGDIEKGDYEKFVNWIKAARAKQWGGFIAMESPGGLIREGLAIGELIRKLNWGTIALETCASSCAMIWAAGSKRSAFPDSHIGFHSAYNIKTGEASGGSNALMGAYLSKLGYNNSAIYYMTCENPKSMGWLSKDKAFELGILTKATYIPMEPKWTAKQYIRDNLRYSDTKELMVKEFNYPPEDKPFIRPNNISEKICQ
jgi:hypothetical protein